MTRKIPILFSAPMIRSILAGAKTQTRRALKTPRGCPKDYVYTPGALVDPAMGWWQNPEHDRVGWSSALPYSVGDRLWVKETWADVNTESGPALLYRADNHLHFCTDDAYPVEYERYPGCLFSMWCGDLLRGEPGHKWRSPRYMPKWASRITLEVTAVRVERLQDITEADCFAEGLEKLDQTIGRDGQIVPTRYACNEGWNQQRTDYDDGELIEGGVYSQFGWDDPRAVYADLWDHINGVGSWNANPWIAAVTFRRVTTIEGRAEPVREIANAE
jgi:hypothetical protein